MEERGLEQSWFKQSEVDNVPPYFNRRPVHNRETCGMAEGKLEITAVFEPCTSNLQLRGELT